MTKTSPTDAPATPNDRVPIEKFETLLTHYRTELELNAEERRRQRSNVVECDAIAHALDLVIYAPNSITEVSRSSPSLKLLR